MRAKKINRSHNNLSLVLGVISTAACTAVFITLPVVLQNYNNAKIQAALVQASLFASGLTGVATLEIARKITESDSGEENSQPTNITVNNISNYRNYHNTNIDNRINSPEEIVYLLGKIQDELVNAELPQREKQKVIAYLEAAELEVREEEPDKDFVAKNLTRVTETLKSNAVAATLETVKSLLPQILKIMGL